MIKVLYFTGDIDNVKLLLPDGFVLKVIDANSVDITNIFKIYLNEVKNSSQIYCVSDDIYFLFILYRLYHYTFDQFVYIPSNGKELKIDKTIKEKFLQPSIQEKENIFKSIYIVGNIDIKLDNLKLIKNVKNFTTIQEEKYKKQTEVPIQKIFVLENKILISEFLSFKYVIIFLDDSVFPQEINYKTFFYETDSLLWLQEQLSLTFKAIDKAGEGNKDLIEQQERDLNKLDEYKQKKYILYSKFIIDKLGISVFKYYNIGFLEKLNFFTPLMFDSIVDETMRDKNLLVKNKFFLLNQFVSLDFRRSLDRKGDPRYLWILYKDIYNSYKAMFSGIEFIPKEHRNKDLVFIITGQYLGELHSPSKLILDRAYHLIKDFKKEILLINTTELLTKEGQIPFYKNDLSFKNDNFDSTTNSIEYKNINIPYYQPSVDMPNENEIGNILSIVQEYKPYFILNFGSINLTGDICSNLVTTVSFPTTSNLPISQSQIRINRLELTDKDLEFLKELEVDPKSVIVSHPKLEQIDSKIEYSKKDFRLPTDKFLLGVVGNRLTNEITEEFISILCETFQHNTHVIFIGDFLTYNKMCDKFPNLKANSTLLGFHKNLIDVMKLFDLYVNPARVGGGSAIYCLMHSVPIVTLNYGDIHSSTQGTFSVGSYSEMQEQIIKYAIDKKYYSTQSIISKEEYSKLVGIKNEVLDKLNKIEMNSYFK